VVGSFSFSVSLRKAEPPLQRRRQLASTGDGEVVGAAPALDPGTFHLP
jgi:hypothetical protein